MNFFHRDEAFVEIEQLTNEAISRLLSATPTDGVLPGAATGGTASGTCTLRATACRGETCSAYSFFLPVAMRQVAAATSNVAA